MTNPCWDVSTWLFLKNSIFGHFYCWWRKTAENRGYIYPDRKIEVTKSLFARKIVLLNHRVPRNFLQFDLFEVFILPCCTYLHKLPLLMDGSMDRQNLFLLNIEYFGCFRYPRLRSAFGLTSLGKTTTPPTNYQNLGFFS